MSLKNKLDWNDISIVPEILSNISSRSEIDSFIDGKLPIFSAPMDTVIDHSNVQKFYSSGINICLPRNIKYEPGVSDENFFYSYGLDEAEYAFKSGNLPTRMLIDVANGHMLRLYELSNDIKNKYGNNIELMVGNIANPSTYGKYCEIGVDYIRVGIGGGSACTTSSNVSIHYPMASLINECSIISRNYENPTKIIADGGFRSFADIIKALALGANYVMIGGILNKSIESCAQNFIMDSKNELVSISSEEAINNFLDGIDVYKYYRGMSTKEVQRSWNRKEIKTGEGISKYNKVEYSIDGWIENFTDYLKSAMSYTNSLNLNEFIGKVNWIVISEMAFSRFNK